MAREKEIDGILSFGVDPGVVSASYVQTQMGIPSFGPFESVEISQEGDNGYLQGALIFSASYPILQLNPMYVESPLLPAHDASAGKSHSQPSYVR